MFYLWDKIEAKIYYENRILCHTITWVIKVYLPKAKNVWSKNKAREKYRIHETFRLPKIL